MKTINLFNTDIVVFIIAVICTILFLSFFNIIKPDKTTPYNFVPYPQFSPKDIPDNNINTTSDSNCFNKLTECDSEGKCSSCGIEYKCTNVSQKGDYTFNNMTVPEGNWCLPENLSNQSCNRNTGGWIWVNDPAYCQNLNSQIGNSKNPNQCWKCECKYPNLYGSIISDQHNDCSIPVENNGKLFATREAQLEDPSIKEGDIWDPSSSNTNILQYNPYQLTKTGKPYFKYKCNDGYLNLPNDPYKCHPDICSIPNSGSNHGIAKLKGDTNDKNTLYCGCNDSSVGLNTIPDGKLKGKCFKKENVCSTWDGTSCGNCGSNTSYSVQCKSNYANTDRNDLIACVDKENPVGIQCINGCNGISCQNGGTLRLDTTKNPPECSCDCSTGSILIDGKTVTPRDNPDWTWSNSSCTNACLKSGTVTSKYYSGFGSQGSTDTFYNPKNCCSGNTKITSECGFLCLAKTDTTSCT